MPNWTNDDGTSCFQVDLQASVNEGWERYLRSKNTDKVLVNKVEAKQKQLELLSQQHQTLLEKIEALEIEITNLQLPMANKY